MNSTKTCYLDANVLVYFKTVSALQHERAVNLLESLIREKFTLYISPLCLDEFLYAARIYVAKLKPKDVRRELRKYLTSILELPHTTIINPPYERKLQLKVIDFMVRFSLGPRDAYHLFIMKTHKIRYFATFDDDFDEVFKREVLKRIEVQ